MDTVDSELEKAGFPGFKELQDMVGREIQNLVAQDSENQYLYSPVGWSKVYREIVYPRVSKKFELKSRTESIEAKKKLKKGAGLASSSGKKSSEPKKEEEKWGYDDYAKDVASRQLY